MAHAERGEATEMAVVVGALFRLAAGQPQLLAAHVASYAALLREEGAVSAAQARRTLSLLAILMVCSTAGVVLAGVGLMLWAIAPVVSLQVIWILAVTPLLPLAAAAWAWRSIRGSGPLPLWAAWQQQLAADGALFRQFRRH